MPSIKILQRDLIPVVPSSTYICDHCHVTIISQEARPLHIGSVAYSLLDDSEFLFNVINGIYKTFLNPMPLLF